MKMISNRISFFQSYKNQRAVIMSKENSEVDPSGPLLLVT